MLRKKVVYKYKTPFRGSYENFPTLTNGKVTVRMGAAPIRMKICCIKYYHKVNTE